MESRLNAQEERELFRKYQQGDLQARDKLLDSQMGFIRFLAKKILVPKIEFGDLVGEGILAFIENLPGFDITKKTRIRTYLERRIENAMLDYSAGNFSWGKFPIGVFKEYRRFIAIKEAMKKDLGINDIGFEEILEKMAEGYGGYEGNKVAGHRREALRALALKDNFPKEGVFLERLKYSDLNEKSLRRGLIFQEQVKRELQKAMGILSKREREILSLRFGLNGGLSYTLEEIGRKLRVTRERIRQIEFKSLRKLRDYNENHRGCLSELVA